MTDWGIEEKHLSYILEVLNKHLENAQYYIFGSRAAGTYNVYSDIDIAVDAEGRQLTSDMLAEINSEFQNSTFPYEVDIVDLNSLSENFRSMINLKPFKF